MRADNWWMCRVLCTDMIFLDMQILQCLQVFYLAVYFKVASLTLGQSYIRGLGTDSRGLNWWSFHNHNKHRGELCTLFMRGTLLRTIPIKQIRSRLQNIRPKPYFQYNRQSVQWNLSVTTTSIIKFISCDLFSNVFKWRPEVPIYSW